MINLKRLIAICCACLVGVCSCCLAATPPDPRDHLNSFNFEAEVDYRALLLKKLLVSTEDYGRFLILPSVSSEGEAALAVHAGDHGHEQEVFVTYTRADRNLWNANEYPETNKEAVKITRVDVAIPKSTAVALAEAWKRMLYRTQAPGLGGPLANDATEFEVSLTDEHGEALYGKLPLGRGKHTEALYQLGKMLVTYCEANPSKRPVISQQIERDANALVAELSKNPFCRP